MMVISKEAKFNTLQGYRLQKAYLFLTYALCPTRAYVKDLKTIFMKYVFLSIQKIAKMVVL